MSWHLSLLRKYSSYNHSRILSQLKTELKSKPIERRKVQPEESSYRRGTDHRNYQPSTNVSSNLSINKTKSVNVTPIDTSGNETSFKAGVVEVGSTVTFNNTNMTLQKNSHDAARIEPVEENQQSFKERLKTIEMR